MTAPGRSTVFAPRGAVATSHPLATSEALRVMREGGNAVDAAVVAAAILGVVEPSMTGIGGDAFAQVWWAPERKLFGLDASGRSGELATAEALERAGDGRMPERGAATVSVPGAVSGWHALLSRFGTLPFAEALDPAIRLAESGFPVSPLVAAGWAEEADTLRGDVGAAQTFLVDGVRAPKVGEWFVNPDLAETMRSVARGGPEVLYGGSLGSTLIDGLTRLGGLITLHDLSEHTPRWVEPIHVDFMGFRVSELPPAGQGIAALQMLRIVQPMDLLSMGFNSGDYLHHLVEAKKLAFADLSGHIADSDHMRVSAEAMLTEETVSERRRLIDSDKASQPGPGRYGDGRDTIYLAVGDAQGNMVSFINSIYWPFGSGVVVPSTGFALQNRGSAFVLEVNHPNCAAPGKRPLHTIIPAMLSSGEEAVMAFGVVGRSMQPQGQVQVLLNHLLWGMDLQSAIDAPRFRHLEGLELALEPEIDGRVAADLSKRGHELASPDGLLFGGAQVVKRLDRGWAAASDPRRDGCAGGY